MPLSLSEFPSSALFVCEHGDARIASSCDVHAMPEPIALDGYRSVANRQREYGRRLRVEFRLCLYDDRSRLRFWGRCVVALRSAVVEDEHEQARGDDDRDERRDLPSSLNLWRVHRRIGVESWGG